jgi:Tol biopolymer transport system component
MIDDRELFERAVGRFAPPERSFERLLTRRDRKHRNKRITAGVVALVVAAAGTSALLRAFPTGPMPANPPEEQSVDLGIFEPVAGRIVYFTNSSLWAVDPSAPSPSTLVRLGLEGTPDADSRFASFTVPLGWSSDGTELLFMREDPTDETFPPTRHLFILHADGTETQVTPGPVGGAAISPDGSRVIFAADDGGLYVVDAEGGQPVRIADEGESPTFSPDGTQIAYLSESGQAGIEHVWVANADGTDAHEILTGEALAMGMSGLTWSPAGDRIAMENQQEGHVAIYTFAPDGSDFTKVITGGFNHSWSPDGSQIAYGLPGRDGLSIADADGSNVQTFGFAAPGPWHPGTLENAAGEPRPSPSPGFSRFNSTIHRISIDYPSDWQVRPTTEPWNHDAFTFDAPGVDVIFDPTLQEDLYISLASEPLGGQSAEDWWGSALGWAADEVCETGGTYGGLSFDGWPGGARGCDSDEDQVIAVATATHGYVIYLHVGDDPILRARYNWNNCFGPLTLETVELR